jgi:hypothetical protein
MTFNIRNMGDVQTIITRIEDGINIQRKTDTFDDYKVLMGGQLEVVKKKLLAEFPNSFEEMRLVAYDFARKIVDKRAKLYKDGVQRTFLVNGERDLEQQQVLDQVYKDADVTGQLKIANRLYELSNYVLTQVYLREDNTLAMRVIPAHLFDAIPNLMGNVEVIVMTHYIDKGMQRWYAVDSVNETKYYTLWDAQNHVVVRESIVTTSNGGEKVKTKSYEYVPIEGNTDNLNPIGRLAFSLIKQQTDGFFYPLRKDLAQESVTLCLMLSDIASIARNQGFGQAVLICDAAVMPENLKVGIKSLIKIPMQDGSASNPRFEFVNSNAPIQEQLAVIKEYVGMLLSMNDLSGDELTGQVDGANALNGISRLIESSKLNDALDTTKSRFEAAEQDLFEVILSWLNMMRASNSLPEAYRAYKDQPTTLSLTWHEVKPIQGEEDKLNMIERKAELGLILPWEKHKIMNVQLTDDEAKQREEEIKASKVQSMAEQQYIMSTLGMDANQAGQNEQEANAQDENVKQQDNTNAKDEQFQAKKTKQE